jgi:hypothetical protein
MLICIGLRMWCLRSGLVGLLDQQQGLLEAYTQSEHVSRID